MKSSSSMKIRNLVAAIIGRHQIIYGIIFMYAAIFQMGDKMEEKTKTFLITSPGIQAWALFIFSCLTLFSGLLIFLNWQLGRKAAAVLCLFNAAADFFMGYTYYVTGPYQSLADFYFVFACISLIFGGLLYTSYLKKVEAVG